MVKAFIMVKIGADEPRGWAQAIKDKLHKVQGVEEIYSVFGRYDLIVVIEVENVDAVAMIIHDEIRSIQGVENTETFVVHK